jgi:hypothetical protein
LIGLWNSLHTPLLPLAPTRHPLTLQLINNAKLAVLFTETLQKKFAQSPLPYVEGTNPPEVKSWREFVPSSASQ